MKQKKSINNIFYERRIVMKKMVTKAMSVMFLFALAVTLNAGVVGTIPQGDDGGIMPLHDLELDTEIEF